MRNLQSLLICGVLALWTGGLLPAQEGKVTIVTPTVIAPPEHPVTAAEFHEYYALAGLKNTLQQVMAQFLKGVRVTSAETVPPSVWDQMQADFDKYDFEAAMLPAYQRYVSQDDIAAAIAYMKSDSALRIKENAPYIQSAIEQVTRKAGQEIGEKAARDHMDEIIALQKKNDADAAARANGTKSQPAIVLPPEVKPK